MSRSSFCFFFSSSFFHNLSFQIALCILHCVCYNTSFKTCHFLPMNWGPPTGVSRFRPCDELGESSLHEKHSQATIPAKWVFKGRLCLCFLVLCWSPCRLHPPSEELRVARSRFRWACIQGFNIDLCSFNLLGPLPQTDYYLDFYSYLKSEGRYWQWLPFTFFSCILPARHAGKKRCVIVRYPVLNNAWTAPI